MTGVSVEITSKLRLYFWAILPKYRNAIKAWIAGGSMIGLSTQAYLEAASAAITSQRPLLESMREINLRFLQAARKAVDLGAYHSGPELGLAAPLFQSPAVEAFEGASRFPFLLMDLGMATASTVNELLKRYGRIQDKDTHPLYAEHLALARSALVVAWHAARTDCTGALLLFDLSPAIAQELATLALHDVEALAPMCVSPLTLRWRANAGLWRQLLNAEACESVDIVRGFVMHAVQLTATSHVK
jgi:hypothetical protein